MNTLFVIVAVLLLIGFSALYISGRMGAHVDRDEEHEEGVARLRAAGFLADFDLGLLQQDAAHDLEFLLTVIRRDVGLLPGEESSVRDTIARLKAAARTNGPKHAA